MYADDEASAPAKTSADQHCPDIRSQPLTRWRSLASRFSRHPAHACRRAGLAVPPPVDPLQALNERWQQLPAKISLTDLEKDPDLAQTQIQLIYDTELTTQQVCGAPAGDDALLLRIAQAPNQVEEE